MAIDQTTPVDEVSSSSTNLNVRSNDEHSKIGTVWVTLAVFAILLLLLVIFISQNSANVRISFLGLHGNLSFGVSLLLSAVIGSILTLLIGSARILQLKAQRKQRDNSSTS